MIPASTRALLFLPGLTFLLMAQPGSAQEMSMSSATPEYSDEQINFFESKIRPALVEHCYKCHSEDGDKIKGGLLLDTREMSLVGGDTGPAVVPGDLDESLLYTAVLYTDTDLEMPPKYKLDPDVIADFKLWIEMGAPDPRERKSKSGAPAEYTNTIDVEAGREHWAYQLPSLSEKPNPATSDWAINAVDTFIEKGRDAAGLTPAPDAEALTLVRRLYFDLTGLPPRREQVEAFVTGYEADPETTLAKTVDELLASDQFGERWGRHWLDVARYGESSGKEVNATFPHAWRYRDYVIDAFNADKPFDEFLQEQIAGDLLDAETPEEKAEHLVATSFLAIGTKGLNEVNSRQFRFDLADEQLDTTTQAFLATTVACARCHDHKFDPIPMADYYSMAGIFLSSETLYGTAEALQSRRTTELVSLPAASTTTTGTETKTLGEMIEMSFQMTLLEERLEEITEEVRELRRSGDADGARAKLNQILRARNQVGIQRRILDSYDDDGNPIAFSMGVRDREEPFDSQILIRGEEDNPATERAPRGFLQVIQTNNQSAIGTHESGRRQLAEWMTSPENPLTARVYANRVWGWLIGEGLVTSVDNFGTTGEKPSHPELLDYLALTLIDSGWSTKNLIREIVTSRTYRMSSDYNEAQFQKDPENRLLWRAHRKRLDAESLRDATLAVSQQLDLKRPEGSMVSQVGDGFVGRNIQEAQLNTPSSHRSVYLPIVRGLVPESLSLFDFSDPSLLSGKREVTTVPSQALYLMNSDFAIRSAAAMADYLAGEQELRGPELATAAFYLCYSRPPTPEESAHTKDYIERFLEVARAENLSVEKSRRMALTTFCQSLISSAEFRYLN
ncbi:MAG: PSD1 and planctomycete cytochrome C domain-containing protein [Verrucomicrobiales bacterium]|nr:PSD1 and planctomycete cytochrome C domain-containing protein [Verrucomicrobiales bacterium]